MSKTPWTARRLAARLRALSHEHGAPNRYRLCEVDPYAEAASALAISRIARCQMAALNALLPGCEVSYERRDTHGPAYICIDHAP